MHNAIRHTIVSTDDAGSDMVHLHPRCAYEEKWASSNQDLLKGI